MTALFDIADVNKSASAINPDKLAWINQQHLMRLPPAEIVPELRWQLERLGVGSGRTTHARGRDRRPARALEDAQGDGRGEPVLLRGAGGLRGEGCAQEPDAGDGASARAGARRVSPRSLTGAQTRSMAAIQALAEAGGLGLGKVAQPIRVAVSGGGVSPPIDQTLAILGREETLRRIDRAIDYARR